MSGDGDDVQSADGSLRHLEGEVRVASRIIDYLSSGLYATPGACLKELVNNSYDADAMHVRLSVKPSAFTVTLEDDGTGLTAKQFETHFKKIADSRKRESTDTTESGRKKIGKIGIGFIAANELCDRMRIESSVAGSVELLDVVVDFEAMRNEPAERRDEDGSIHKGDYSGEVFETDADRHFTRVTLFDLKDEAKDALIRSEPEESQVARALRSVYGMAPNSVRDLLADMATWSDLDRYSQTMLQVALNVPVEYPERWLGTNIASRTKAMADIERQFAERSAALGFRVTYDGTELRKPVVLKAQRKSCIVKEIRHEGEHLSYSGYLFASHGTMAPKELQGVLIRVREAAIGDYSQDLLNFPQSRFSLLQRWVSGEIYASDELEEADYRSSSLKPPAPAPPASSTDPAAPPSTKPTRPATSSTTTKTTKAPPASSPTPTAPHAAPSPTTPTANSPTTPSAGSNNNHSSPTRVSTPTVRQGSSTSGLGSTARSLDNSQRRIRK